MLTKAARKYKVVTQMGNQGRPTTTSKCNGLMMVKLGLFMVNIWTNVSLATRYSLFQLKSLR